MIHPERAGIVEGGGIWSWVVATTRCEGGKRTVSIIQEDPDIPIDPGTEPGREPSSRRYAEALPVKYEQFTGFGPVEKQCLLNPDSPWHLECANQQL